MTNTPLRVLGRTRLSRSSEESTSIERQREIIESWANANGHQVVGWADDIGVSGSVDPFATAGLGPWLTDDRLGDWDILCAWKMDRLARRTVPMHRLFGWIQEHEKTLVCVADNIDLSHWVGRLIASVIAGVAEGELEAIRERNTASQKKLREVGRWHGGKPPYGYRPAPLEGGGWTLELDPETSKVVLRIVREVLDGAPPTVVAKALTAEGTLTPTDYDEVRRGKPAKGKRWTSQGMFSILRSQALLGRIVSEGVVVRDDTGSPILQGPPLIDLETFERLQTALEARAGVPGPRTRSALNKVVVCWDCGANLSYRRTKPRPTGGYYDFYHCRNECYSQCNAQVLTETVYDLFKAHLESAEVMEKRVTRATDHSSRIADLEAGISDLAEAMSGMSSSAGIARVSAQLQRLDAELTELEAEHTTEATVEWVGTGTTYGDAWRSADADGKRDILTRAGIVVRARPLLAGNRARRGTVEVDFGIPHDLRERLQLRAGWEPESVSTDDLDVSDEAKAALKRP